MIFVTVGTQLPFDRLVGWVDRWAEANPSQQVFVQCGAGGELPKHAQYSIDMTPEDWDSHFKESNVVVSHAGMGTILKCLDADKPLLIVPRIAELNEHRNNHQLATAQQLKLIAGLTVVEDEQALNDWLNKKLNEQLDTLAREMPDIKRNNAKPINSKPVNPNLMMLCTKLRAYVNSL